MRRLLIPATLLMVAALVIATSPGFWGSRFLWEEGDLAANALQVERAREGHELLGPYSQHEFNHPGPVSYYLQAWAEPLLPMFPSLLARHSALQLALNLLTCALMLHLLARGGTGPATTVAGAFLLMAPMVFLSGGNAIMLGSVWGPTMTILPMALATVAAARLIDGDLASMPIGACAAILAFHNHLLTLPALATLAVAVAIGRSRRAPALSPTMGSLRGRSLVGLTAIIGAAGLAPIIVDQLAKAPGNLSLIARYLQTQEPGHHAWSEVLSTIGPAFTDPLVVIFPASATTVSGPVGTATIIAAFMLASAVLDRRRPRTWRTVLRLAWLVIALTAVVAHRVSGPLHTYLFYYVYGLVGIISLAIATGFAGLTPRRLASAVHHAPLAVATIGLVVTGAWLSQHPLAAPPARDEVGDLIRSLDLHSGTTVKLVLGKHQDDESLWPQVPTHALRLRRAGFRATVPQRFVVMCGRETAAPAIAAEAVELEFTRTAPDSGFSRIFARDGWNVVCRMRD